MKSFYYAVWSVIFMLPLPLKIFVEFVLFFLAAALAWFLLKYVLFGLSRLLLFLNVAVLGGIRRIFGKLFSGRESAYVWDERIGQVGQTVGKWLKKMGGNVTKISFFRIFKSKIIIFFLICVYVAAILPVFKLENYISPYYVKPIYSVNRMFVRMEKSLTINKDNYPDLIPLPNKKEEKKAKKKKKEQTEEEPIYLWMKEGLQKANIRESPSLEAASLCIISEQDQMVYLNVYERDSEKYWLKVSIPTRENIEGWVSEKVITEDILQTLNLQ